MMPEIKKNRFISSGPIEMRSASIKSWFSLATNDTGFSPGLALQAKRASFLEVAVCLRLYTLSIRATIPAVASNAGTSAISVPMRSPISVFTQDLTCEFWTLCLAPCNSFASKKHSSPSFHFRYSAGATSMVRQAGFREVSISLVPSPAALAPLASGGSATTLLALSQISSILVNSALAAFCFSSTTLIRSATSPARYKATP